jgi:Gamma-glutamyltransferase
VLTPGQTVVQLPGIMTTSDLRAYQARVRAPTRVRYRGLDIYSMAPPSSSGSTVGEALNILSGYNLSAEPRVTALFHYLEASRLAYADRNAYVGDPALRERAAVRAARPGVRRDQALPDR